MFWAFTETIRKSAQRLLKRKEADNYSTLYKNAEKDTKGQFRGVDITQMTLKQVLAFQRKRGPKSFLQYNIDKYKKDTTAAGVKGVYFAVWAPTAHSVSVVGDFNFWKQGEHLLQVRWDSSGIWEGFISADNQTLNRIIQEFEEDAKSSRPTRRPTK